MQDKIQEIMGLVDEYADACFDQALHQREHDNAPEHARQLVESKLRELVREPLSDSQINSMDCVLLDFEDDGSCQISSRSVSEFARSIERAHNITNTSGVE